ncbi:ATP-binding cassette domain-containing protein [Kitasatospora sp. NPDC056531]|uniref:ATP-binding cassette domain-containing protein n=1 Tax=Kitasatospora sp. NPDC056531 TaxID=3345856 RepID=UPI00368D23BB
MVPQVEESDCGPACLGILLAHQGRPVPAERLRADCGVSRDGTTAADLVRAAAKHGLVGRGIRLRLTAAADGADLGPLRELPLPAVALLHQSHFVVLEGVTARGDVAVNDPGRGRLRLGPDEFAGAFSGIVLTFTSEVDRAARPARRPWLRACLDWLGDARREAVVAVLLGLLTGALLAAEAILVRQTSLHLMERQDASVLGLLVLLAGTAVGAALIGWSQRRLLSKVLIRTSARHTRALVDRMMSLPGIFVHRRFTSGLVSQVRFTDTVTVLLAHRVLPMLAGTALLLPLLGVVGRLSLPFLLALLAGGGIGVALRSVADRRAVLPRRMLANELARRTGIGLAGLTAVNTLQAEGADADLFAELAELTARDVKARDEAAAAVRWWYAAATALELLLPLAALGLSGWSFGHPVPDAADAVGVLAVLAPLLLTARTVVETARELPEFLSRTAVLEDVRNAEPEPRFLARAQYDGTAARLRGRVELDDVRFGYAEHRPAVLRDITARIEPGQRVVVLGPAGSGKSTLLRILSGALEPTGGHVLLDGRRLQEVPRATLLRSVGYVSQEPGFFDGSVADNVTLWDDGISDELVEAALADACLDDVVERRGGRSAAHVERDARNFAGGERQRLALARALARDPAVLLLDEPTGALDPLLAARVDANLRRRGVTTVIVTQDPAAARSADLVLSLPSAAPARPGPHRAAAKQSQGTT